MIYTVARVLRGLVLGALAAISLSAQAWPTYHLIDLSRYVGGETDGGALDINAHGQVAGFVCCSPQAFLYDFRTHSAVRVWDGSGPDTTGFADGISDKGWVTGRSSPNTCRAFLYDGSSFRYLFSPPADGACSMGKAVNSRGWVVGFYGGDDSHTARAFLYDGVRSRDIGTGRAEDINDCGVIVGTSDSGHAFIRDQKGRRNLGLERWNSAWVGSTAMAINARGWITGAVTRADGTQQAYLYDRKRVRLLGAGSGSDVNRAGQVVGSGANGPFLFDGHRIYPLSSLLDNGAGLVLDAANAINDSGMIVGRFHYVTDEGVTFGRAFIAMPMNN